MNEKQKAKLFDLLCEKINQRIDDKIPDWLADNPYWEIDDEERRHYPQTTIDDAIENICEDILKNAEDMDLYDFFEVVLNEVCNNSISRGNKVLEEIKGLENE